MKKIVIISPPGQIDRELIALLTALFPEIAVIVYEIRNYGDVERIKGAVDDALVKSLIIRNIAKQ